MNFLITGATGSLGSVLLRHLRQCNLEKKDGHHVTAIVRDTQKAQHILENICRQINHIDSAIKSEVTFLQADITDRNDMLKISGKFDYIIHCAAITNSSRMVTNPVETTDVIVTGTKNILELAYRCQVKSMVYLSSMEIYGKIPDTTSLVDETMLGDIDIFNVRSCYPMGKRMAENLCYSYYMEYGIPVKIARLSQTFGTGILPGDNRIYAQFVQAVRSGRDIVLHTAGEAMGNYCDTEDAIDAIMILLERGENGQAYNVVNEDNTMTIRQMAELVAEKIAGGKIRVVYDIPQGNPYGYAADTGLRLSSAKLRSLGWTPKTGLESMYRKM